MELSRSVVFVISCFILIVSSLLCVSCSFVSCPCFPPFWSHEFHLCLVVGPAPDCSLLGSPCTSCPCLPMSVSGRRHTYIVCHSFASNCQCKSPALDLFVFEPWGHFQLSFSGGEKIALFFPSTLHFRLPCHLSMKDVLRSKWMTDVLVNYVFHCCYIFSVWLT